QFRNIFLSIKFKSTNSKLIYFITNYSFLCYNVGNYTGGGLMIKPGKLQRGDTVALISLSSGLAGEEDIRWRTEQGIELLDNVFGLKVKVMPHALKGLDYVYNHPEKRAEDLNDALRDDSVKAIICAIGGNETVRILPFIDTEALKNNPKTFTGYSDTTTNHLFFYKYGISTSYGTALLDL